MGVFQDIRNWEARIRSHYNKDLSTPENRRLNRIYNLWFDHEIVRMFWTNFYEIAPGVYRSNQPTRARFEKMKAMGINTVLNLRGENPNGHYLAEEKYCRDLGLTLHSVELNARGLVDHRILLRLIELFKTIDRPFVMHCKSGADRAGLASAIYLMVIEGKPVEEARKMLSWRYMHIRNRHVGILDYMLDVYAARNRRDPIDFETWIATEYDREEITDRFRKRLPAE